MPQPGTDDLALVTSPMSTISAVSPACPRTRSWTANWFYFLLPFFAWRAAGTEYLSDEVWSLELVRHPFAERIAALANDVHPPVYFELLAVWTRLFGESEWSVHSLSALLYVGAVIAFRRLAKLVLEPEAVLTATALYACAPIALRLAGYGRMYSLMMLLGVLSSTFLVQSLEGTESSETRRRELALFAINVLGSFTHLWFLFLIAGEAVACLLARVRSRIRTLCWVLGSALLYVVLWGPVLYRQVGRSREAAAWIETLGQDEVTNFLILFFGISLVLLPPLFWQAWRQGISYLFALSRSGFFPLIAGGLVSLGIPIVISLVQPIFVTRYAIVVLHLCALALGAALTRQFGMRIPAVLATLTSATLIWGMVQPEICTSRFGAAFLRQHAAAHDAVIQTSFSRLPTDYYLGEHASRLRETSYPAAIDSHPGYEGRLYGPDKQQALRQEAAALADRLRREQPHGSHVFAFIGVRPEVDTILSGELKRTLRLLPEKCYRCAGMGSYYGEIQVYEVP